MYVFGLDIPLIEIMIFVLLILIVLAILVGWWFVKIRRLSSALVVLEETELEELKNLGLEVKLPLRVQKIIIENEEAKSRMLEKIIASKENNKMLKQIAVSKVKKKSLLKRLGEKEAQLRRTIPRIAFITRMKILNTVSKLMRREKAIVQALEEAERLLGKMLKFKSQTGANASRLGKRRVVEKTGAVQKAGGMIGRVKSRNLMSQKMTPETIDKVERAVERAKKREWKYWRERNGNTKAVQSHHAREIAENRQRPTTK